MATTFKNMTARKSSVGLSTASRRSRGNSTRCSLCCCQSHSNVNGCAPVRAGTMPSQSSLTGTDALPKRPTSSKATSSISAQTPHTKTTAPQSESDAEIIWRIGSDGPRGRVTLTSLPTSTCLVSLLAFAPLMCLSSYPEPVGQATQSRQVHRRLVQEWHDNNCSNAQPRPVSSSDLEWRTSAKNPRYSFPRRSLGPNQCLAAVP